MNEVFKVIPSFPDYLVSNLGRVKTRSRKIRYTHSVNGKEYFRQSSERFLKTQYNNRSGYKFHQLYLNKKMHNVCVHKLVADAFLDRVDGFDVVNHKDGNKHNNCVDNLEYCTNEYNHYHATITGLKASGGRVSSSKLNENSVKAIRYLSSIGVSNRDLSIAFNVSRPNIIAIIKRKTWKQLCD